MVNRTRKLAESIALKLDQAARRDARAALSEGTNLADVAHFLKRIDQAKRHMRDGLRKVEDGSARIEGDDIPF